MVLLEPDLWGVKPVLCEPLCGVCVALLLGTAPPLCEVLFAIVVGVMGGCSPAAATE